MAYMSYVCNFKVYKNRDEYYSELINEVITLFMIYFLMCFTGDFVSNTLTQGQMGIAVISLTSFNFLFNILLLLRNSIVTPIYNCCRKRKAIKKQKEAQKKRQEAAQAKKYV